MEGCTNLAPGMSEKKVRSCLEGTSAKGSLRDGRKVVSRGSLWRELSGRYAVDGVDQVPPWEEVRMMWRVLSWRCKPV